MSRTVKPPRRGGARPALLATLALGVAAVIALALGAPGPAAQPAAQPTPAPHFVDVRQPDQSAAQARTVVVAQADETLPRMSADEGPLMTTLVRGQIPAGARQALVRTDENCAPDEQGVSHCLNELEIGAVRVVVQHHHKMSTTPCLTPGETVNLIGLAEHQAQS